MEGPKADTQVATGAPDYASEGKPTARVGAGGGPAQPKLRGSCHSCATSKVKCPKEKPTCSRCKARGVACQYFLTRRPGRRREGSISRITNGDANTSTSNKTVKSSRDRRTSAHSQGQRPRASNLSQSPSSERRKDGSAGLSDDGMEEDNNHDTIQVMPRLSVDVPFSAANTTASPSAGSIAGANNYLGTPMSISTYPELEHMSAIEQGDQYRDQYPDQYPDLEDSAVFSVSDMMLLEHDLDNFDFVLSDLDPVSLDPVSFKMPSLAGSVGSGHLHNDTASILMQAPAERSSLDLILPSSAPPAEDVSYSTSSTGSSLAASIHGSVLNKGKGMAASILGGGRACGCLEEALGLLRMLSSPTTGSSRSSVSSSSASDRPQDTVLRENQQTIDAISGMISCPTCAEDTFFLTVVSMIILKTLRRYAAAARPSCASSSGRAGENPNLNCGNAAADGSGVPHVKGARSASSILFSSQDQLRALARRDDRGRDRASAQLVLGELHRVQRLVNQLSPKLKRNRDAAAGDGHGLGPDVDLLRCGSGVVRGGAAVDVARVCVGSPETESTCFSANTLDQIERDVRWSLAGLSAEIIKRLRQD